MTRRALVLGGGGLAGITWETGILTGLADANLDVTGAELTIGTSAGSTVAAQVGSGPRLEELFRRQVDPSAHNRELTPAGASGSEFLDTLTRVMAEPLTRSIAATRGRSRPRGGHGTRTGPPGGHREPAQPGKVARKKS